MDVDNEYGTGTRSMNIVQIYEICIEMKNVLSSLNLFSNDYSLVL